MAGTGISTTDVEDQPGATSLIRRLNRARSELLPLGSPRGPQGLNLMQLNYTPYLLYMYTWPGFRLVAQGREADTDTAIGKAVIRTCTAVAGTGISTTAVEDQPGATRLIRRLNRAILELLPLGSPMGPQGLNLRQTLLTRRRVRSPVVSPK